MTRRAQEGGIYVCPVVVAGNRPDVVDQPTVGPPSRLPQGNGARPQAPLFGAEQIVGGGRQAKNRSGAPDYAAGRRRARRKEKTLQDIANTELITGAG
jgi:hypothetical protein